MKYNVQDWIRSGDQASLDHLFEIVHDGDRIYFPYIAELGAGTPYTAPVGGWVITKSLEIYGDGPGNPANNLGTLLRPSSDTPSP